MRFDFDRWIVSRPRWERLYFVVAILWSWAVGCIQGVQGNFGEGYDYTSAVMSGPGLALAVYLALRIGSLLLRKREPLSRSDG